MVNTSRPGLTRTLIGVPIANPAASNQRPLAIKGVKN
jgi:hypothetical protein